MTSSESTSHTILCVSQIAGMRNVSRAAIYEAIALGRLKVAGRTPGGKFLITRPDYDAYLAGLTRRAPNARYMCGVLPTLVLVMLLTLVGSGAAQVTVNGDRQFLGQLDASTATLTAPLRVVSADPATCDAAKHEIYFNSTTAKARICNATNTWSDFTGSGAAASAGASGTLQEGDGSGGFVASPCAEAFGLVTCSKAFQLRLSYGVQIVGGFGPQMCATSYTFQPGGLDVVTMTADCTFSTASPQYDGEILEVVVCEDSIGGHIPTFPASLAGVGAPNTAANKCNAQRFFSSDRGGSLGGRTINATWFALGPMVSY